MLHSVVLIVFGKIGLLFNLIGSIFIAISFGKNLGEAYQEDRKGRKVYLASFIYPTMFKWGIGLLILGFLIQIFTG